MIDEDKVNGLAEVYLLLVESVGIANAEIIFENFKGQQIVFPMRLYRSEFVASEVERRYDGKNLKSLAMEYGYSEGYLRKIIAKTK